MVQGDSDGYSFFVAMRTDRNFNFYFKKVFTYLFGGQRERERAREHAPIYSSLPNVQDGQSSAGVGARSQE